METRSVDQMLKIVEEDPERLQALQTSPNPLGELKKLAADAKASEPVWTRDKWLYRIAVIALTALVLIAAVGYVALRFGDKDIPEALVALGSTAAGGLVGLFVRLPTDKEPA